jgi:NAD(P)H-nitrite reductase large subunit
MSPNASTHPAAPLAMTRCECVQLSFATLAARILTRGEDVDEALEATGCGSLCTACVPDLRKYLGALAPRERAA